MTSIRLIFRKLFFILLVSGSLLTLSPSQGEASLTAQESQAQDAIVSVGSDILDTLRRHSEGSLTREEVLETFRRLLTDHFDFAAISGLTLGRYARTLSTEQKREYVRILREFLVQTYVSQFLAYEVESFEVVKTRSDSRQRYFFVDIVISVKDSESPPLEMTWRLRSRKEKMLVVDFEVAGVSMVRTQRNEFEGFIRQNNGRVEALLEALRKRIE